LGHKRQYPSELNWQTTNPVTTFLPLNNNTATRGSVPSGITNGSMTGTTTIYSNIVDSSLLDNIGAEVTYTGTATGTITVMASNSGINFYALTFSPTLAQPSGSFGGYLIDLNQLPFRYYMFVYTNVSGTGSLTVYMQAKDIN
jgi:hypothetical protein